MTAREQARAAVAALDFDPGHPLRSSDGVHAEQADAASDVWEPLLRDLFRAVDLSYPEGHYPPPRLASALDRAREALG